MMKIVFGLAAAGFVLSLSTTTPANAQKDPACTEKCNRENKASGGGMPVRETVVAADHRRIARGAIAAGGIGTELL